MNEKIIQATKKIIAASKEDIAVVLIGSVARGKETAQSDIDILIVGKDRPEIPTHLPGFHLQHASEAAFLSNLQRREDFEIWCVRLGVPLHDSGIWARILRSEFSNRWPDWKTKVLHGARRLLLADQQLKFGDIDAASEELLYALGHTVRGLLLKGGVFPMSRPELAEQVSELGYPQLATLHEELRTSSSVPRRTLLIAARYSKRILCHLDRMSYRKCLEDFRSKAKAKIGRKSVNDFHPIPENRK